MELVSSASGACSTSRPRLMIRTSSTVLVSSASRWLDTSTVPPPVGVGADEAAQPAHAVGVQAVGRLVEDQDVGVAQQRGGEASRCRMPSE